MFVGTKDRLTIQKWEEVKGMKAERASAKEEENRRRQTMRMVEDEARKAQWLEERRMERYFELKRASEV